ncbi:MAG TPA: hypothetical protein VIX86_01455, partial [Streptosporangiaceae bacterium]
AVCGVPSGSIAAIRPGSASARAQKPPDTRTHLPVVVRGPLRPGYAGPSPAGKPRPGRGPVSHGPAPGQ